MRLKFDWKEIPKSILALSLLGLFLLIICIIPVTNVEEVINTSFTVNSGDSFRNYENASYHTRIFGKSVLKCYLLIDEEAIYLTAKGYNTQHLQNIHIENQYNFMIDPAFDCYNFSFNNTIDNNNCLVEFKLEEVWIRPIIISTPSFLIAGLSGFFIFFTGLIAFVISRLIKNLRLG